MDPRRTAVPSRMMAAASLLPRATWPSSALPVVLPLTMSATKPLSSDVALANNTAFGGLPLRPPSPREWLVLVVAVASPARGADRRQGDVMRAVVMAAPTSHSSAPPGRGAAGIRDVPRGARGEPISSRDMANRDARLEVADELGAGGGGCPDRPVRWLLDKSTKGSG
jgi:hypothetical protein